MSIKASDFRTVGRQHAQAKRWRERQAAIRAAEDAYDLAAAAGQADATPANMAAWNAATDALYELDPRNYRLT